MQPLAGVPAAVGAAAEVSAAGDMGACRRARPCTPASTKRASSRATRLPRGAMIVGGCCTGFKEVKSWANKQAQKAGQLGGEGYPQVGRFLLSATCHLPRQLASLVECLSRRPNLKTVPSCCAHLGMAAATVPAQLLSLPPPCLEAMLNEYDATLSTCKLRAQELYLAQPSVRHESARVPSASCCQGSRQSSHCRCAAGVTLLQDARLLSALLQEPEERHYAHHLAYRKAA